MTSEADPLTGAVRLSRAAFDEALAAPETEGTLGEALAAVRSAGSRLQLEHAGIPSEGWVGPEAAALLVPAADGLLDLVTLPPTFLPEALARMADLGPRPRPRADLRVRLTEQELAGLGREAPADLEEEERLLLDAPRGRWRAEASWRDEGGLGRRRTVEVLDARGLWLVRGAPEGVELAATTATEVWRQLVRLSVAARFSQGA